MKAMLLSRLSKSLLLLILTLVTTAHLLSQTAAHGTGQSTKPSQGPFVRDVDPTASCKFASLYQRISENKNDPRVAFIELSKFVHASENLKFGDLCRYISDQSLDTHVFFDKTRAFLHVVWGVAPLDEALALFSRGSSTHGIFLYMQRDGSEFNRFVFDYSNGEWHDVTQDYLGSFGLASNDYIVVPQYGQTARVLGYDQAKHTFHHRLRLRRNGVKFESQVTKPKDWHCPDSYQRYFSLVSRRQFCQ